MSYHQHQQQHSQQLESSYNVRNNHMYPPTSAPSTEMLQPQWSSHMIGTTSNPTSMPGPDQHLTSMSHSPWTESSMQFTEWPSQFTSPAPSVSQVPDLAFTPSGTPCSSTSPHHQDGSRLPPSHMNEDLRKRPHLNQTRSQDNVHSPARRRATSGDQYWHCAPNMLMSQYPYPSHGMVQQALPAVQGSPSTLLTHHQQQSQIPTMPTIGQPRTRPGPIRHNRSSSSVPTNSNRYRPYHPPQEDLQSADERLRPIRQEPAFEGDVYTPRWKRRNFAGRWEGWCDLCPKGRWLDLKNSRYWEDKMRNHGICARTKRPFPDPVSTRWVTGSGEDLTVVSEPMGDNHGTLGRGTAPDGEARKRQGQCGNCAKWVDMDGQRTRARDRAVGWWMHAYHCFKDEAVNSGTEGGEEGVQGKSLQQHGKSHASNK